MQKEGKKRVPSTRAEKPGLHPNFTCVRGDKGCRNPIPAGMLRKPRDWPQVCPRTKKIKGLPRATHCTDRAQTSGNVSPTVELCPPHPKFRKKVRARKDMPEGKKKSQLYIYILLAILYVTLNTALKNGSRLFPLPPPRHKKTLWDYFSTEPTSRLLYVCIYQHNQPQACKIQ